MRNVVALFLSLFMSLVSELGFADQVASCAPLLSRSRVIQGIPFTRLESQNDGSEDSNWSKAYLSLLDLVLEGIDEINLHAFGHGDRMQVKAQLLDELITSEKPISPLDLLANLVNFSPKLSTLADSGQFETITEKLKNEDWQNIRQTIEQKINHLQTLNTAQATAKLATEADYEDPPDANGNTRLIRLILQKRFAEAQRLVSSSRISTRYINHVNKGKTATDYFRTLFNVSEPNGSLGEQGYLLHRALHDKRALSYRQMLDLHTEYDSAAEKNDRTKIMDIYNQGVSVNFNPQDYYSIYYAALNADASTLRLLLELNTDAKDFATVFYSEALERSASLPHIAVLLEFFDFKSTSKRSPQTPFHHATLANRTDVLILLAERGASKHPLDRDIVRSFIALNRQYKAPDPAVLDTLVQLGIDLEPPSIDGRTVAHLVAMQRPTRTDLLHKVCALGLRIDTFDNIDKKTPRDYLKQSDVPSQRAIEYCLALRQKYSHVSPEKVFQVAYLDTLEKILDNVGTLISTPLSATDLNIFKRKILEMIISSDEKPLSPAPFLSNFKYEFKTILGQPDFLIDYLMVLGLDYISLPQQQEIRQIIIQKLEKLNAAAPNDWHDINGENFLHRLIRGRVGYLNIKALVDFGFFTTRQLNHRNKKGQTPLDIVPSIGYFIWEDLKDVASSANNLKDKMRSLGALRGTELKSIDEKFLQAVQNESLQELNELYQKGANINVRLDDGRTALHLIVQKNNLSLAKMLLGWNAEVRAQNRKIPPAIEYATSTEMRELLALHMKETSVISRTRQVWQRLFGSQP